MNAEIVARLEGSFSSQPASSDLGLVLDMYKVTVENQASMLEMRLEMAKMRVDSLTLRANQLLLETDKDVTKMSNDELEKAEASAAELRKVESQLTEIRDEMKELVSARKMMQKSLGEVHGAVTSKLEELDAFKPSQPTKQ